MRTILPWSLLVFFLGSVACGVGSRGEGQTDGNGGTSGERGTGGIGGGGSGGDAGGAAGARGGSGGTAGVGGSGGDDGGTGGSGGWGGNGEIDGPKGALAVVVDFPEEYGEIFFRIGSSFLPATEVREGCDERASYVLEVPEGQWRITARSTKGFEWLILVSAEKGTCSSAELLADDCTSSFEALGFKMSNHFAKTTLPVHYTIFRSETTSEKLITKPFTWEEAYDHSDFSDRPRSILVELSLDGKLLIVPLNYDDAYPIIADGTSANGNGSYRDTFFGRWAYDYSIEVTGIGE